MYLPNNSFNKMLANYLYTGKNALKAREIVILIQIVLVTLCVATITATGTI